MNEGKNPRIKCRYCKKDILVSKLYHHLSLYHFSDFWEAKRAHEPSNNMQKLKRQIELKRYNPFLVCFKEHKDGDEFWFCPSSLSIYRREKMAKIALEKDKDRSLYIKNAEDILKPREDVKVVIKEVIKTVGGEDFSKERETWIKLVRDLMQSLAEEKATSFNLDSKFDILSEMCLQPMFDERNALRIVPPSPKEMGVEKMEPDPILQEKRECLMKPLFTSSQIYHIYGEEKEFKITQDDIFNKEAKALFKKYSEQLNAPSTPLQEVPS